MPVLQENSSKTNASSTRLTCTNTPGKQLVPTNKVYVSPEDFPQQCFLAIKDCIFTAEPHAKIPKGEIGLNKIQRQSAHVSASAVVDAQVYNPPQENFLLNMITLGM
jgi:hypothetical protein